VASSALGRDGHEETLLTGIFQTLEQHLGSLLRAGLESLLLWSLGALIGMALALWGLRRAGLLGQTPPQQRRSKRALWAVFLLVCWPALTLPPAAKAVAHRTREVIASASDRIGLTGPVGAAVLSPITTQLWARGLMLPPLVKAEARKGDRDAWVDASALLDLATRDMLLASLTPDAIWAQGEPVRQAVFAARHPLPDWLMRYLVERGHRMLCDDLSMYAAILHGAAAAAPPPPTRDDPRDAHGIPPALPLSAVHAYAGRAFLRDYAGPFVEGFMSHIAWIGRLIALGALTITAALCAALTRRPDRR
jgi:hypothetical protein